MGRQPTKPERSKGGWGVKDWLVWAEEAHRQNLICLTTCGGRATRVEINEVVPQVRKPAWKPLEGQEPSEEQHVHCQDTEDQYNGDWSKLDRNGLKKLWADADQDEPADSWDAWNSGWAPRDQSDIRYRDLLGDVDDDADVLPGRGFYRGDDSQPVAATPGNAHQQSFSAGAHDPGELGQTPAQFADQQRREKEAADKLETERQQRTALLEEQAKQQQVNTFQTQHEVRQQQDAQSAELARQNTVVRAEAAQAAQARKEVEAVLTRQSTAADATALLIAKLQADQVEQQARTAAMATASEYTATQVQSLTTLLQGQSASLSNLAATVTNLQSSVGGLNANMTDLAAKMDLLLSSVGKGSRNDSAMGEGRDSTAASDAEPERRRKVR